MYKEPQGCLATLKLVVEFIELIPGFAYTEMDATELFTSLLKPVELAQLHGFDSAQQQTDYPVATAATLAY